MLNSDIVDLSNIFQELPIAKRKSSRRSKKEENEEKEVEMDAFKLKLKKMKLMQ